MSAMIARLTLLAVALTAAGPSLAVNTGVFRDAPVSRMTKEEVSSFRRAVIAALEKGEDGKTAEWTGDRPKVNSRITPTRSFEREGRRCRETVIETEALDLHQRGTWTFCRTPKGEWTFAGAPAKKAQK